MSKIKYDLLPKQRTQKHNVKVSINIYKLAEELWKELDKIGMIDRIKELPQLGVIKVKKKFFKSRYDYMMLQLYLHQLIRDNISGDLWYTYNNKIKSKEFIKDYYCFNMENEPSLGDVLQILIIMYNVGHFYNTFTASRAIIMITNEDENFYNLVINACKEFRYQNVAKKILESKNYQKLHLLNSILILENCDKSKPSVSLALEILYSYINEEHLPEESKLKYAFKLYENVRKVSYMAYDLQIAETPLIIDLCNGKTMTLLLKELLSEYNNNQSSIDLVGSITKLLDDTVYNENSNAICYYKISRKMVSLLKTHIDCTHVNYYNDLFINKLSILNQMHPHRRDYAQSHILKLTFTSEQRKVSELLLPKLEKLNYTRVGYYDRPSGEQTILVSIKNKCDSDVKKNTAYKVLKYVINYLRRIPNISCYDTRFLLTVKFFLFYLFDENPMVINPTINRDICVVCTRGKNAQKKEINKLLESSIGNDDENHEIKFILKWIENDSINDTTITIPASILVYKKEEKGKELCEFDGLIINPMRKSDQIIFLEAKNMNKKKNFGKKCLIKKLNKLSFKCNLDDIQNAKCDAFYTYTIK